MAYILCLETSGTNCSVCIADNSKVIAVKELNTTNFSHAENLHVFIEEILKENNISFSLIKAVAVSSGPGSYTGLRIGVSSAKGLCFAWNIPLIAVPTLAILAQNVSTEEGVIIPMLDARRMEVYTCVFDKNYNMICPVEPKILDENSYSDFLQNEKVIFLGDGSDKFAHICSHSNASFVKNQFPSAKNMVKLAFDRFQKQQFENMAYFEPFYLKSFQGKEL